MVDSKAIKERSAKKNTGNRNRGNQNIPHKHCRMCGIDISIKSEKRVCSNEDCTKKMGKQEKNDKMMSAYMSEFVSYNVLDSDFVSQKNKLLNSRRP